MNCRRVEELIPLYVEGDLESGIADRISSHLEWCGRCNWLADDFRESQSWLRSSAAPEFDDSALSALKAGILKRLAETNARPSLWSNLIQHWSRRQVFALSTALLIILGIVVLYVFQTRAKFGVPVSRVVESKQNEETGQPPDDAGPAGGAAAATKANSEKRHHSTKGRLHSSSRYHKNMFAKRAGAQTGSRVRVAAERAGLPPMNTNTRFGDSPKMLRIEIQTSDPNIRIIWFAPKETDSNQTKPATD